MAKITKKSFLSGILSPTLSAEMESEIYQEGLYRCENYMPDLLGGIKSRPGMQYLGDGALPQETRLIPFVFNEEQAYTLVFGDLLMRIIKDGAFVESGGSPVELVTTIVGAQFLENLSYTQSADTLYVSAGGGYPIATITRTSDIAWTYTEVSGTWNGPYRSREVGDEDIMVNVVPATLPDWTVSSNTAIFDDVEVGDCFRVGLPVEGDLTALLWRWFLVKTLTSDKIIVATLQGDALMANQTILNHDFNRGLVFWEEKSTNDSSVSYNATNENIEMTMGAAGSAILEQAIVTSPNKRYRIGYDVSALTGSGTKSVTINVGTTALASDIFQAVITTPTVADWPVLVPSAVAYVSFDTVGSTAADVITIDSMSISLWGDDLAVEESFNTTDWTKGEFNSTRGWPKHLLIDNQRLICANTDAKPQTVWPSVLGNFESFEESTPTRTTDSFSFKPSTETKNGIQWLIEKDGLKAGTADAVWRVFAPSGGVISPSDIAVEVDEAEGSLSLRPIVAHNAILMTPRGVSPVLEMISSLEAKGFQTRDIASQAEHLFKDRRIIRWAFAKDPDSVVWCILDDGQLLGLTYHRRMGVAAWHTHTCALNGRYLDVAVIPNSTDDNTDDVYFLKHVGDPYGASPDPGSFSIEMLNVRIKRQSADFGVATTGSPYDYRTLDSALTLDSPTTISAITQDTPPVVTAAGHGLSNGNTIRIQSALGINADGDIEGMVVNNVVYLVAGVAGHTFELNDSAGNPIDGTGFLAYRTGGEAREMVTTITGLTHLANRTVTALADGAARENLVVSAGGVVTLPIAASFAHVGVPYTCEAATLDLEGNFQSGTSQGDKKSTQEVDIYFNESRNLKVYASNRPDNEQEVLFENESTGQDPPALFTGIKSETEVKSETDKQVRLVFKQDKPYPSHIQRAIIDVDFSG